MRTTELLVWMSLLAPSLGAQVEPEAMAVAHRYSLRSDVLGEDRGLWVSLPEGYEDSEERYPVLILLDGRSHVLHTAGTAQFLAREGLMPEVIVVGVENTERMRDMTTTHDEAAPFPTGGAGEFLSFLCDEATPWVDAEFRTRPVRLLIGHSLGGLVVLHALRTRPEFFAGLVAISPSMQWDEQVEVARLEEWLATGPQVRCSLYITAANETGLVGAAYRTAGLLDVDPPDGLRWKFQHMPDETHGSVPFLSTYDGFRFLFEGWTPHDMAQAYLDRGWRGLVSGVERARARFGFGYEPTAYQLLDAVFWLSMRGEVAAAERFVDEAEIEERGLPPMLLGLFAGALTDDATGGDEDPVDEARRALGLEFHRIVLRADPWHAGSRAALEAAGFDPEPAVELDVAEDELARFAGVYSAGARVRTLVLEDGHLYCVEDGADSRRLFAKSSNELWTTDGTGFVFRVGPSDGAVELEEITRERRVLGRREPPELP